MNMGVVMTAQPTVGSIGRLIRSILRGTERRADDNEIGAKAVAALFAADRSEHIESCIDPALNSGHHVICDRHYHSSLAYQSIEVPFDYVAAINAPMKTPDLIIYLEVDVSIGRKRRELRQGIPEVFEVDDFQLQLSAAYEKAFAFRDQERVHRIDGNRDISLVQADVLKAALETINGTT